MLTTAVTGSTASSLGIPQTIASGIGAAVGAPYIATALSIAVVVVVVFAVMIATGEISTDIFPNFWGDREVKAQEPKRTRITIRIPVTTTPEGHTRSIRVNDREREREVKGAVTVLGEPDNRIRAEGIMHQSPNTTTTIPEGISVPTIPSNIVANQIEGPRSATAPAPLVPSRIELITGSTDGNTTMVDPTILANTVFQALVYFGKTVTQQHNPSIIPTNPTLITVTQV